MLNLENIIKELSKDNLKLTEQQIVDLKELCEFENERCVKFNTENYYLVEDMVISGLKLAIASGNMKEKIN